MKKKIFGKILLILLIIAIAVLTGLYIGDKNIRDTIDRVILKKYLKESDLKSIHLENDEKIYSTVFNENVGIFKNGELTIYNKKGNQETVLKLDIIEPIFETKGRYLIVADKNRNNIYMIYNNFVQKHKRLESDIKSIYVTENGGIGVISSSPVYKSIITVYDLTMNEIFKYYMANSVVTKFFLTEDLKNFGIVESKINGAIISSKINIISVEKVRKNEEDPILLSYELESGEYAFDIANIGGQFIIVTNKGIFSIQNKEKKEIYISNSKTEIMDIGLKNKICIVERNEEDKLVLKTFDIDKKQENIYEIDEFKYINTKYNDIIIENDNEITILSDNAIMKKNFKSENKIQKIYVERGILGIKIHDDIRILTF